MSWGEGWGSGWGGEPPPGPVPVPSTDRMGIAIRTLIQAAMGMPDNSVRPENQKAGKSNLTGEYATVRIISQRNLAQPETFKTQQEDGSYVEQVCIMKELMVSVNFLHVPEKDAAGLPLYSTQAFDKASRLPVRLRLSQFTDMMQQMGIGFLRASPPRDLTGIVPGEYESRGQVDLYLCVQTVENGPIDIYERFGGATITVEEPDGTIDETTIEVTP